MEDKLGVRLFVREARRLVANPAGRRMLVASRLVLAELRSAERDVRDIRDGANGRRFREQQPNIEVRIETVPGDDPISALVDDRVDVALVTKLDRQADRVVLSPLFDDEMVAVVAGQHPWAGRRYVTARDFDDAHLILYDVYDQTRIPSTPLPVPHGARPPRITTMPVITDLLIEMVAGGEGATVLPNWVAAPYTASHDVEIVHLGAKPLIRTWYCATRPGPRLPHVDAFVQELTRELETPTRRDLRAPERPQRKATR